MNKEDLEFINEAIDFLELAISNVTPECLPPEDVAELYVQSLDTSKNTPTN